MTAALAGCTPHRASYADRADAVCRREQHAIAKLPAVLSAGVFDRREARRFIGAMQKQVDAAEQLRVASLTSDSESAQGAQYQGRQAARRAGIAAQALGLEVCAA